MNIASFSAYINHSLPGILDIKNVIGLISIIVSAFFGGFFAAFLTYKFELRRTKEEKRRDKYYEHRNSIVQIEHELSPLRLNISRNLESIKGAIDYTREYDIRFILRFYELKLSAGLNLKLLNLDFINDYAELCIDIDSFNSDIKYLSGIVSMIFEDHKKGIHDLSAFEAYKTFLPYLKEKCEELDQKSLDLITKSKLALQIQDKKLLEIYKKDGKLVKYTFNKRSFQNKIKQINKEETVSSNKDNKKPQFISPYLDLKREPIQQRPTS